MSEIRTNLLKSERGDASPSAPFGLRVSGVTTTGTLNVTGSATISGNLGVAGTITYEDVARVDATGISTFREGFGVGPLAGIALTAYKDGSIRTSGIVTAASFVGDGSALTGLAGLSLANGVDNRIVTCVDATSMQGESNLFYQGDFLTQLTDSDQEGIRLISSGNTGSVLDFDANRDTDNRHLGEVRGKWNGAEVCRITLSSGADTTNKDEGKLVFHTKPSSGGIAERLRIESGGQLGIGGANYGTSGQVLTSGGASAPPSWASIPAGGITQADFWRLTANLQANQLPIASNLARVNTYGFDNNAKIGSGMTQSSGVWTFPATGLYWVRGFCNVYSANHSQTNTLQIRYTADGGSNWASASIGAQGIYDYGIDSFGYISVDAMIDVTSTSNIKVAFNFGAGQGGEYIQGHSVYTYTGFIFIRLGDT